MSECVEAAEAAKVKKLADGGRPFAKSPFRRKPPRSENTDGGRRRVSRSKSLLALLGFVSLSVLPCTASATTFFFTGGTATVTATAGADTVLGATVIPLDGAFINFDPLGAGDLVDFSITIPQTSTLNLTTDYGGYDEVVIESASLAPGVGYTNINNQSLGGGVYTFLAGPIDIEGVYSASDSTNTNPPVMDVPVPFTDTSLLVGTVDTTLGTLELTGLTLTQLPAAAFGETDNLVVKADILFTGVVPEPSTGLLVGVGMALMTIRRRSRASR